MPMIEIDGVPVNVAVAGSGPPLVLLHGFPLDHTMWRYQIERFSEDRMVIAPDLRGFGHSGVTPGTVTMAQHADDLAAILQALSLAEPVVVCGLSMGGYVALQFVQRHRDRLRALILCDTRSAADGDEVRQTRLKMAEHALRAGTALLAESMPPKLFAAGSVGTEVERATRELILKAHPEGVAAAQRGMAERPDMTDPLRGIDVPTLLIVGEEDVITPASEMRAMAALLPKSQFVAIPGAGHMAPLEQPEAVNAAIEQFLLTV